ncbi:alkaline phosphatase family protein [Marinicrinis sediminis]|uniref:Alkaline phosphatase family protein n=1 Tax=Marinicrinis sediminis TaxID=1652465 RepID=A0ABW5R9X1_9BACL
MKEASKFEKVAARCWNILNEGKPFTPVFTVGVFLLFHLANWHDIDFWNHAGITFLTLLPILLIYYHYDFPLHLRTFLWLPLLASIFIFSPASIGLYGLALGLYFFFTVIFWGTIYYHLRIGTTWTNYRRFWKLVLKNSDSTSGNAQEQVPKVLLLLTIAAFVHTYRSSPIYFWQDQWVVYVLFLLLLALYSAVIHRVGFNWKPDPLPYTDNADPSLHMDVDRVFVLVVDGCRKDRLAEAHTPFMDWVKTEGTEFTQMETIYPDRTVVCFTSMFTGTYPFEHGIQSNMVWKQGIRCESLFDSLRKEGKVGRLLGIAHLVDSMGDDVDTVTAVMHNDRADGHIIDRAKQVMQKHDPDFMVVQLIATDQTGHSRGALYEEYKQKIEEADAHLQGFYEWLKENQYWTDRSVMMICADHGQSDGIGGHGHLDEGERFVPFMMMGHGIQKGVQVDELKSLVSITPTVSQLLGVPLPNKSRGPVLWEAIRHPQHVTDKGESSNE